MGRRHPRLETPAVLRVPCARNLYLSTNATNFKARVTKYVSERSISVRQRGNYEYCPSQYKLLRKGLQKYLFNSCYERIWGYSVLRHINVLVIVIITVAGKGTIEEISLQATRRNSQWRRRRDVLRGQTAECSTVGKQRPATAPSPMVERQVRRTTSDDDEAERSRWWATTADDWWNSSAR